MNIKGTLFGIVLNGMAAGLAADSTSDLVNAEHVQRRLYLQVSRGSLEYAIDDDPDFQPLGKDQVFAIERSFKLGFRGFNPLKYRVVVNSAESPDPSFAAITDFLSKVAQFQTALKDAQAAVSAAPGAKATPEGEAGEKGAPRPTPTPKPARVPSCPKEFDDFREGLISAAAGILEDDSPKAPIVAEWIKGASGQGGVIDQRNAIRETSKNIRDNLKNDRASLDRILKTLDPISADNTSAKIQELLKDKRWHCADSDVYTLSALVAIGYRADNLLRAKAAVADALDNLVKLLDKYEFGWLPTSGCHDCDETDYELLSAKGDPSKTLTVTVSVSRLTLSPAELSITAEPEVITTSFALRRYRSLIPEVAAGVIYSGLRRPRFGTGMLDGHLVVRPAGSEPPDYSVAVLLNGVFNVWSGIHPMIQLGVSYTKEAPALLLGGGLRITQAKGLGLAGGLLMGWIEELDELKPNSPIDGTEDIERDLKLKQHFSYYVAVQYSF